MTPDIEVRPFSDATDYESMVDYFLAGDDAFLTTMGVDRSKLPEREAWLRSLALDHQRDDARKDRCYLAWLHRGRRVGHSSISKIRIGEEAYIHLHLWRQDLRKGGLGTEFFRASADYFADRFRLQRLLCEPKADNAAPNRVLSKLGFRFVRRYKTVPGDINVEQEVHRYELAVGR